ncbi:VapE family protein [Paraburkholderia sp. A2WS-5]|uniref:VapE domain-containing protein n=1 Tax=unclassified Paraburkholderia TaxID=2615204 RepID=UPI003B7EDFA9
MQVDERKQEYQDNEVNVPPVRSYQVEGYDWSEIPIEWCASTSRGRGPVNVTDPEVIKDIWHYMSLNIGVYESGWKGNAHRHAIDAWPNVEPELRKPYEEKAEADRAAKAADFGARLASGELRALYERMRDGDLAASEEWTDLPISFRNRVEAVVREENAISERRAIKNKHKSLLDRVKPLRESQLVDWAKMTKAPGVSAADFNAAKKLGVPVEMVPDAGVQANHFRMFDALYVGGRLDEVHYDTARRMLVDESGKLINDEWAPRELVDASFKLQMSGLSAEQLIKSLKNWALDHKFNDISERVRNKLGTLEWDGKPRLSSFLIDLFQCVNSEDNRLFSKYWCRSLYERVMNPGCLAPISLCLFGAQDAGKSHFSRLLCRELMFDKDAAAVPYDPAGDVKNFLRNISGLSVIANMSEMTNFGKIDLRKWKSFSTETTDTFDQKFGFSGAWPRQWIFILDSNRYEGLWRDNDDTDEHDQSKGDPTLKESVRVQALKEACVLAGITVIDDAGRTKKVPTLDDLYKEHGAALVAKANAEGYDARN